MSSCPICGTAGTRPRKRRAATETLGRAFFGLAPGGALCPGCLETVELAGAAVHDACGPPACPECLRLRDAAWASPGPCAPGAARDGAPPARPPEAGLGG